MIVRHANFRGSDNDGEFLQAFGNVFADVYPQGTAAAIYQHLKIST